MTSLFIDMKTVDEKIKILTDLRDDLLTRDDADYDAIIVWINKMIGVIEKQEDYDSGNIFNALKNLSESLDGFNIFADTINDLNIDKDKKH